MLKLRNKLVPCLALVSACTISSQVWAGGGGPIGDATEMTQMMNNVELVVQVKEQIKSNLVQLTQYATQLDQYRRQLTDGLNVGAMLPGLSLDGLSKEINAARNTYQSYQQLFGSVDELSRAWQQRMVEASNQGIPLEQYIRYEGERIQKGNETAIRRIQQEQRVMDQVEQDFALAKEWGQSISGQQGIHQSLGLLNTQMNRMLHQNARMAQLMAQAQGSDKAREEQETAMKLAQQRTLMKKIQDRNNQQYDAMRSSIQSIPNTKPQPATAFDKLK